MEICEVAICYFSRPFCFFHDIVFTSKTMSFETCIFISIHVFILESYVRDNQVLVIELVDLLFILVIVIGHFYYFHTLLICSDIRLTSLGGIKRGSSHLFLCLDIALMSIGV